MALIPSLHTGVSPPVPESSSAFQKKMAPTKQTGRPAAKRPGSGRVAKQSGGKEPRAAKTAPTANSIYSKERLKVILLEQSIPDCIFCPLKFALQEQLKEHVRFECKNLKLTPFLERLPLGLYTYFTSAETIRNFRVDMPQIRQHVNDLEFGEKFCMWPEDLCTFLIQSTRFPFRFNKRNGFGKNGSFKKYPGREDHEMFLDSFKIQLSQEKYDTIIIPLIFYGGGGGEEWEKGDNNNPYLRNFHHISMLYLYKVYLEDGSCTWECTYVESCNQDKITSLVLGRRILPTFLFKVFGKRITIKGRIFNNTTWNSSGTFFLAMLIVLRQSGEMPFPTSPGVLEGLKLRYMDEKREPIRKDVPSKKQDFVNDVINGTSEYEKVTTARLTPRFDYLAKTLHGAMDRLGTKDTTAMEIICTSSSDDLKSIQEAYQRLFDTSLEDDVIGDTSGDFRRILVSLLNGGRDPPDSEVLESEVESDAQALFDAGEGQWGTDESVFNSIMTSRSIRHLRQVFSKYDEICGISIEKSIKREFSGDIKHAMLTIVKCVYSPAAYFAKRIRDVMTKSDEINHDKLIFIFVSRCDIDLQKIKEEYETLAGEPLGDKIESETSGDYRMALKMLLGEL